MARGFGATLGVGATDKIVSTVAPPSGVLSVWIWTYRNGDGGSNFGGAFRKTNTGGFGLFNNSGGNVYSFVYPWSGSGFSSAAWNVSRPSTGTWYSYGVSYDPSSTANDPIVYENGTKNATPSEERAPAGSVISMAGDLLKIGNNNDDSQNWDGLLAEYGIWSAVLSDGEFAALHAGFAPKLIRPASLIEYVPMVRDNISLKAGAPSITGTAVQSHPRIILATRRAP